MLNNNPKIDKAPTVAKCDVKVKLYGNNPIKLPEKTNKNIVNINEKYFSPSFPIFSTTIF